MKVVRLRFQYREEEYPSHSGGRAERGETGMESVQDILLISYFSSTEQIEP